MITVDGRAFNFLTRVDPNNHIAGEPGRRRKATEETESKLYSINEGLHGEVNEMYPSKNPLPAFRRGARTAPFIMRAISTANRAGSKRTCMPDMNFVQNHHHRSDDDQLCEQRNALGTEDAGNSGEQTACLPGDLTEKKCEWQDSNLRTPTRIDLESITFGRSVTLASVGTVVT